MTRLNPVKISCRKGGVQYLDRSLEGFRPDISYITKVKKKLQLAFGLHIPLNLAVSTEHNNESVFSARALMVAEPITSGWYMIEAKSDHTAIGMLIKLEALDTAKTANDETTELAGWNTIQLGTTATSRRILYLQSSCNQIKLTSDMEGVNANALAIHLTRLTERFASSRLKSALQKLRANTDSQLSTRHLYEIYRSYCPTPTIDESYASRNRKETPLEHSPAATLQILKQWQEILTVLTINTKNDLPAPEEINTPFVLIADKDVKLTTAINDFMRCVIRDSGVTQLWYSDHEHVKPCGKTIHPCYKPAWNPGLLQHGNYIGALIVCRKELFNLVGGVNNQAGQSVIYDFLLKASARLKHDHVSRVPFMVYQLPASDYRYPHGFFAKDDDCRVLRSNVQNIATPDSKVISGPYANTYAIEYNLPDRIPSVEIIIPTRDRSDLLETCVNSVFLLTDYPNFQITVVDNDSCEDATFEFHESMSVRKNYRIVEHPGTFNYSAINNAAVKGSTADIVLLLNNDTEVTQPNWLKRMVLEALQPDVACVGAKLFYGNGLTQHAGMIIGMQGVAGHINRFSRASEDGYAGSMKLSADYSAVTAACLAIRRSVFNSLKGFDEHNLTVAFNDVDFCLRAREAGYRNRFLADVELIHHESVSRGKDDTPEKKARFQNEVEYMKTRHQEYIADDPAWNPNFLRCCNIPSLARI